MEVAAFLRGKQDGRPVRELSVETNVPEKTLSRLMIGGHMPLITTLGQLCLAYNCDIHDIAPSFPHRNHNGNGHRNPL
jgi:hypothetical protein